MTTSVDPKRIEALVGHERDRTLHWGKAYSATQTFYVLHSEECRAANDDLRDCPYSRALDRMHGTGWDVYDQTILLAVTDGRLAVANPEGDQHGQVD